MNLSECKVVLERVRKQSDKDSIKYAELFPVAANYHRGYRDALEWVLEEIDKIR